MEVSPLLMAWNRGLSPLRLFCSQSTPLSSRRCTTLVLSLLIARERIFSSPGGFLLGSAPLRNSCSEMDVSPRVMDVYSGAVKILVSDCLDDEMTLHIAQLW
jgi:hypothetical protein